MNQDALIAANSAKELFSGVNDSFGREISSDVIDEITSLLKSMNSVYEESSQMKHMLLDRIKQSEELGTASTGIEI